jgi:hypothetical protein
MSFCLVHDFMGETRQEHRNEPGTRQVNTCGLHANCLSGGLFRPPTACLQVAVFLRWANFQGSSGTMTRHKRLWWLEETSKPPYFGEVIQQASIMRKGEMARQAKDMMNGRRVLFFVDAAISNQRQR